MGRGIKEQIVLVLTYLLSASNVRGAAPTVSCKSQVAAAIQTIDATVDGSSVACCADRTADCTLSSHGICAPSDTAARCIVASGERACTITYTNATGAPCGITMSASSSTSTLPYGVTPVGSAYPVILPQAATVVALTNWRWLASRSEAALCFSTAGTASTTQITTLETRTCAADEYMLVCHGTGTRGLCTAYSNDASPHELGQYYTVSLEGTPPTSSTAQPTASNRPQSTITSNAGIPRWMLGVVAIVCILGTASLCALGLFVIHMRRRNAPVLETATTPFIESSAVSPAFAHDNHETLPRKRVVMQAVELPPYSDRECDTQLRQNTTLAIAG